MNLTVSEAHNFFVEHDKIKRKLERLKIVGLDYLKIGQSISTLSGGELQRLKIAEHLNTNKKRSAGKKQSILFIFDEPTTGLHLADVEKLILALKRLLTEGHTVVVIEHCLEFIKRQRQQRESANGNEWSALAAVLLNLDEGLSRE